MLKQEAPAAKTPLSAMQAFLRRVPPHLVIRNFLGAEVITALLQHAVANEARFTVTKVGEGGLRRTDASVRVSKRLREIGNMRSTIEARLLARLPEIAPQLGITPFAPAAAELELVAHGDGAFYKAHVDPRRQSASNQRVISAVYYFNAAPKAFQGGALRLRALEGDNHADLEPENDTLAAFPSWALHEVMPVHCASGRFIDSRFAINCWLLRNPDQRALHSQFD
jgi:SM-20-related protein